MLRSPPAEGGDFPATVTTVAAAEIKERLKIHNQI
jgi:hypothetical protein